MEKPRILIVDDTPANIKILNDLLRDEYRISVATNGPDALTLAFSDTPPALILLDIMLPVIDGYEVCEVCRLNSDLSDVKIIFLSAKGTDVDIAKGLFLGADAYITKPFSNTEIIDKVKELVGPCS